MLDRPFEKVACFLGETARCHALLGEAMEIARSEGEGIRARVGPAGWPSAFSKTVDIHFGPSRSLRDSLIVPISWQARSGPSLFPRLEGDLELAPFGPEQAELVLRARYEPPGGALGRRIDRVLLHRVAESTLRAFLGSIGAAMENADQRMHDSQPATNRLLG